MQFRLEFLRLSQTLLPVFLVCQLMYGVESAPLSLEQQLRSAEIAKPKFEEPITIVFLNSCAGAEKHVVETEVGKSGCVNVNLGNRENVIKIEPKGVRLHLFEKDFCEGNPTLFDPKISSQQDEVAGFKVASFLIVNGDEGSSLSST